MATAWSGVLDAGTNIVSNGGLTLTNESGGVANSGTLGNSSKIASNSEKIYLEFTDVILAGASSFVGIANDSWAWGTVSAVNTASISGDGSGTAFGATAPAGTSPDGLRVDMAIDFGAKKNWIRIDGGDWNFDPLADPATGVGAEEWVTDSSSAAFRIAARLSVAGDSVTMNPVGSFIGTPPVGFLPWDSEPPSESESESESEAPSESESESESEAPVYALPVQVVCVG